MQTSHDHQQIPLGMRPGRRELMEGASLMVGMCEGVPAAMRPRLREISKVFVPEQFRRQRRATALLNFVCQEADANRITLLLVVEPYGKDGPTAEQLKDWYEQFGFVQIESQPEGIVMARQVRERPRPVERPKLSLVQAIRQGSN